MPLTASLIIGGVSALAKTGFSLAQHSSAAADARNNKRPTFKIPQEWYDNDHITGAAAMNGLSPATMNYYTSTAGRGLSSGLGAILQGGGNVNTISDLVDTYDQGINKITSEDQTLKNENLNRFIEAHSNLGNEREKAFTLNEYEPWKDRAKADADNMRASETNAWNGVTELGNTVAGYAAGSNKYESTGKQVPGTAPAPNQAAIDQQFSTLPSGVVGSGVYGTSTNNVFSSPGGQDVLRQMVSSNPNSAYIQSLLKQLGQPVLN